MYEWGPHPLGHGAPSAHYDLILAADVVRLSRAHVHIINPSYHCLECIELKILWTHDAIQCAVSPLHWQRHPNRRTHFHAHDQIYGDQRATWKAFSQSIETLMGAFLPIYFFSVALSFC